MRPADACGAKNTTLASITLRQMSVKVRHYFYRFTLTNFQSTFRPTLDVKVVDVDCFLCYFLFTARQHSLLCSALY